jgi:hypothetical protein
MKKKNLVFACAIGLIAVLFSVQIAFAHETVTVGDYDIEYGWVNEPVIVNQPNAVVINISEHQAMSGSVSFMNPTDGAAVQGAQTDVAVMFDGLDANAKDAGVHWHLYMDDKLLSMIPLDQTKVTVTGLTNGSHMLKASLSAGNHSEIGDPAMATINVSGASDTGTPAVSDVMSMTTSDSSQMDMSTTMAADVDVSELVVEASYGGKTKQLTLQPLGEDTPGQFVAPLLPTVTGTYTIKLSGKIDGTDIQPIEVEPEEVQAADIVEFPAAAQNQQSGMKITDWLAIAGFIFGLGGLALGFMAFRKTR